MHLYRKPLVHHLQDKSDDMVAEDAGKCQLPVPRSELEGLGPIVALL
jgi:hypothetical protein